MPLTYTSTTEVPALGVRRGCVISIDPADPRDPVVVSHRYGLEALPHLVDLVEDLTPYGLARQLSPAELQEALLRWIRDPSPRLFRDLRVVP